MVTLGDALFATVTVTVIAGWLAPAASESPRVQVRVASTQAQPVPLIADAFSPNGGVSVTLTAPEVETEPALETTIE